MNKQELLRAVAEKSGMTIKDSGVFYEAFVETVKETLKAGDKIQLVGVGSIELKKVDAKTGINPRTKEAVEIPACNKPVFKFGDAYKKNFN